MNLVNVKAWLERNGREFPKPDGADGSTSQDAYDLAGLPMVVACTHCGMTMTLHEERKCSEDGELFCDTCAEQLDGSDTGALPFPPNKVDAYRYMEWSEESEDVFSDAFKAVAEDVADGGSVENAIEHYSSLFSIAPDALRHEYELRRQR